MSSISTYGAWLGVIACILQSGLFAGLNLAIFSLSLLRLQIEADGGNTDAVKVLELRKNANQVLATVIWGNVTTNVLLTLLSDLTVGQCRATRCRNPLCNRRYVTQVLARCRVRR